MPIGLYIAAAVAINTKLPRRDSNLSPLTPQSDAPTTRLKCDLKCCTCVVALVVVAVVVVVVVTESVIRPFPIPRTNKISSR